MDRGLFKVRDMSCERGGGVLMNVGGLQLCLNVHLSDVMCVSLSLSQSTIFVVCVCERL